MKIYTTPEIMPTYGGPPELVQSSNVYLPIASDAELVELKNLKAIEELPKVYSNVQPESIAKAMNFIVTDFDGIKIYQGRKKGLRLGYAQIEQNQKTQATKFAIFSMGEYQPGRYLCYFEGYAII